MKRKATRLGFYLFAVLLISCTQLPLPFLQASPDGLTKPAEIITPTTPPTLPVPVQGSPTPEGPLIIQIWVPPLFDPNSGTPTGSLLKARLDEFVARKPESQIEVRVKDIEGPGGILDTLTTANSAAQLALPDLVILPYDHLASAVTKRLVYPFDNLSSVMDDPDWYDFARVMAVVEKKIYGLPIAGDALIQIYRNDFTAQPPLDWTSTYTTTTPLLFTASDPMALFTLAQYMAKGGPTHDDQGLPVIDVNLLTEVLTYFQEARIKEVMPYWLTSYQLDQQTWEGFQEGRGNQAITWISRYLDKAEATLSLAPIPTHNGTAYTVGDGWVWALTSPDPMNHPLSVQLAEFLTDASFLAKWTEALGLLPPRPSSLASWSSPVYREQLEPVARAIHLYPPTELLLPLGSALEKATVSILKDQSQPSEAAQLAADSLK